MGQLCKDNETNHPSHQHTDDVTGATVTANNADARLSSLQHHPSEKDLNNMTSLDNAATQEQLTRKKNVKNKNNSTLALDNLESNSHSSSSDSLLAGVEEKREVLLLEMVKPEL